MSNQTQFTIAVIAVCLAIGYGLATMAMKGWSRFSGRAPADRGNVDLDSSSAERRYRMILGVAWNAGEADIETAYRQLLAKYKPENVAHLGDEFRDLAAERTRDLVEAYDHLIRRYQS